MDAHVYLDPEGWKISLRLGDSEVDEAGPFDDEADCILAAQRCIEGTNGQVILPAKGTLLSDSSVVELKEAA